MMQEWKEERAGGSPGRLQVLMRERDEAVANAKQVQEELAELRRTVEMIMNYHVT